ncbi:outer membrane lipoprotein-sorting protein [Pseudomonas sp. WC1]|uniref:outer membrane lipoprotein-sorting protein n=1 Tax=Pseudomonas sp. WC1 TaxID=3424772 RepID=UPI003D335C39
MKRLLIIIGVLCPLLAFAGMPAGNLVPRDIIERSEERPTGKDSVSMLLVTLTDKAGTKRQRGLLWYHLAGEQGDLDLQKFFYPRSIRNIATFNEEVRGAEDLQYLYLPAASRVRRVSSKHQTWVGSDLIYEDLQKINLEDWTFSYVEQASEEGFAVHVVDCQAKPSSNSAYAKRRYYIRADGSYFPSRIDFFDAAGQLIKQVRRTEVQAYGSALYERFVQVNDLRNGHQTLMERRWVRVDTGLPASLVTVRQMEKGIEHFAEPADVQRLVSDETSRMVE